MQARTGNKSYAAAAAIAVALMAVPTFAQAKADDVAATVNGDKILKSQVVSFMKANNVKSEDEPKVFSVVVDQLVDERLIQDAAAKANVEDSAEYKQRMELTKANLAKQLYIENYLKEKVSDKAVKAEYEKLKKDNKGKPEVRARHILVKTEDEAKQIIKDLDSGAKFEDLAKERSTDVNSAKSGGDIGYVAKGDPILPAFTDAAFQVKPGSYSKEPVKTQLGWHVIMVESKRDRVVPELKTVEDQIRTGLAQEAVRQLIKSLSAKADIKRFDIEGKPVQPAQAQ